MERPLGFYFRVIISFIYIRFMPVFPAIPNMKLVMEKNSGEKKTRHPDSERVGAWAIIQHAKLGRLESENSESKNLS
jgi:hypothetical protein